MNLDGLNQLVGDVFGANFETKVINGWVSMRCPLAPWKHQTGKDSRPSAGISIQDAGTSVFNCLTCHTKLPLQALIREYGTFSGEDLSDLVEELEDEAYLGPRELPSWDANRPDPDKDAPSVIDKNLWLDLYDSAAGHRYLKKRGISKKTAELLELKIDPSDPADGEERILFPIFGPNSELHGFSGRAVRSTATMKVRDYAGFKKAKSLMGAHLITRTRPDKICVVEGLFDYANMWQQGFPAVAVMHSTMTEAQAKILKDFNLPVYLFYDYDTAGESGTHIAGRQLNRFMPVMRVRYPEIWIEDPHEDDGGHWLKDPGELLAEDIEEMIRDARLF